MGLAIYGASNITVDNLLIQETGGDGIYVGNIEGGVIRNVVTDGCYRNGMSIIRAIDLLVEDCQFLNTGNTGRYNGGEQLTPANGGTAPRAGVDLEPNLLTDVLQNVTLRNCSAVGNVDDAFDISGDTPHSITLDGCAAANCSGDWGSAFKLDSFTSRGNITLRGCSATNMPGSALGLRRAQPSSRHSGNVSAAARRSLVVEDFEATAVATDWRTTYKGRTLPGFSLFPVTVISDNSDGPIPRAPNDMTIELKNVTVRRSNLGQAAGRPVIGCQSVDRRSQRPPPPAPCVPDELWPLSGSVVVMASNRSACDTAALGRAAANLKVECKGGLP